MRVAKIGRAQRIQSLDVLRAVAAGSVALFHYGWFSFGYLGVELFFLLSGFVLTLPSRHSTAREFVFARCTRLYPAYWACLLMTCIALWCAGTNLGAWQLVANASMLTAFVGERYVDGV